MNTTKLKRSELKKYARASMPGHYGSLAGAVAVLMMLTLSCSMIPTMLFSGTGIFDIVMLNVTLFLISLLLSLMEAGFQKMCLSCMRHEKTSIGDLLYAFYHHPDQYLLTFLILNGASTLISLLFSIPTFQKGTAVSVDLSTGSLAAMETYMESLSTVFLWKAAGSLVSILVLLPFTLSTLVMVDHPGIGPIQALKGSFQLMKKNCLRYLILNLSFAGVYLLGMFSCGIGFLWVTPYITVTMTAFYLERRGELGEPEIL